MVVVYWLIPAEPERELFREIIRILAKQFDAPRFEPHLTLLATRQDRQPPARLLRTIKASPIRLKLRDVASSPRFTRTLFVRLVPNKSLDDLVVDLARVTRSRAKSEARFACQLALQEDVDLNEARTRRHNQAADP